MFHKTTTGLNYPSGNKKNDCIFTEIIILNMGNECNKDKCNKEIIEMKSGGPGYNFFNVSMTANANCPNEHKVFGYAKC